MRLRRKTDWWTFAIWLLLAVALVALPMGNRSALAGSMHLEHSQMADHMHGADKSPVPHCPHSGTQFHCDMAGCGVSHCDAATIPGYAPEFATAVMTANPQTGFITGHSGKPPDHPPRF